MSEDTEPNPKNSLEQTDDEKRATFDSIKAALARKAAKRELPSIKQIVKIAKRSVSSTIDLDTKSRRLAYAIRRIEFIKQFTRVEFDKRLKAGDIDDPEVFYDYIEEANLAISSLSLQIEKLGIAALATQASPQTELIKHPMKSKASPSTPTKVVANPVADVFIDKKQAASYLGISLRTLGYRMKEPGFPVHHHNGRRPLFKKNELDAWAK
jgi:hypothetical protein